MLRSSVNNMMALHLTLQPTLQPKLSCNHPLLVPRIMPGDKASDEWIFEGALEAVDRGTERHIQPPWELSSYVYNIVLGTTMQKPAVIWKHLPETYYPHLWQHQQQHNRQGSCSRIPTGWSVAQRPYQQVEVKSGNETWMRFLEMRVD